MDTKRGCGHNDHTRANDGTGSHVSVQNTLPLLSQHALRLQLAFGELIRLQLASADGDQRPAPVEQRLTASALIGALTQLFIRWLDGSLEVSATELADYCVRLLLTSVPLARPS